MLTVLTPTYNRKYTLPRLYESLRRQSSQEFEWLVVDDGSTDGTMQWVGECANEAQFPIRAVRQENSGKHVALNTGVAAASGDWIFIVDSDDALTSDAVACVDAAVRKAAAVGRVVGICFRSADMDGRMLGRDLSGHDAPLVCNASQIGRMVASDTAYIFRRNAMLRVPFPVIRGEKFVPELYVWNKIGDLGAIWFYPDRVIYLCEYLTDGYTCNFREHLRRNPKGFGLFYSAQIQREAALVNKARMAARYLQCLGFSLAKRLRKMGRHV